MRTLTAPLHRIARAADIAMAFAGATGLAVIRWENHQRAMADPVYAHLSRQTARPRTSQEAEAARDREAEAARIREALGVRPWWQPVASWLARRV